MQAAAGTSDGVVEEGVSAEEDVEEGREGGGALLLSPSLMDPDPWGKVDPLDPDPEDPLDPTEFNMFNRYDVRFLISDPFVEAPCSSTKTGTAPAASMAARSAGAPSSATRVSNDTTIGRVCAEPE